MDQLRAKQRALVDEEGLAPPAKRRYKANDNTTECLDGVLINSDQKRRSIEVLLN